MLNRGFVDPLLNFSEVCRDELRDFPRGRYALLAPISERRLSGRDDGAGKKEPTP
jgi:hypothetical protein